MMRKITITLEESLIEALSKAAMKTGLKKTQIIRDALKSHLLTIQKDTLKQEWLKRNKTAIERYNRHVEEHGIFAQEYRTF
ncbi:MAG: type II toxin-antitoxin system CcdA family antitoxin [Hydrogenimonas sp.]|nr:type II toxin-antitoxin system CcdA family antitoxin [Hydrogenimonas sp.]